MNLRDYDTSRTYEAVVKETERITPEDSDVEVRHLLLEVPDRTFHFIEGQSVGVLVPGPHEFGNEYHMRLYSIASGRQGEGDAACFSLCVRRCFYIDEVSGEQYPGVASNFLCDRRVGDTVTLTGPYGRHFVVPRDDNANLLMIGNGTGIAPFRAFVKHIYGERGGWKGKVRLFYGAQTGMELLYMNDVKDDFTNYYDDDTFKAFEAISPRGHIQDVNEDLEKAIDAQRQEVWEMVQDPNTYVYVSGLERVRDDLEKVLVKMAGSPEAWEKVKSALVAEHRWSELYYR